jgi:adenine-specific DNA-methyltransferase
MNGESLDIKQTRLQRLKELFPELFAETQLDWEKLKAAFGDDINFVNERYVLNWAGKSDAFRVLQQSTTATLKPAPEESVNFEITENLFIEGENLEVLKALQKAYYGKVKCIEIDPPYNTGSDSFIYPDRFSEKKEDYLKRIGDKDEEGFLLKEGLFRKNSKDSGHFHSNWLSMMYPRLFLSKNLLRHDGVIFVHIDDNEVHNLRMVMNEIFGEENFVDCIIWKKRYGGGAKEKYLVSIHEYMLFYAKNKDMLDPLYISQDRDAIEKYYKLKDEKFKTRGPYRTHPLEAGKAVGERKNLVFAIKAPDGTEIWPKRQWYWSRDRVQQALKNNELDFVKGKDGWTVHTKQYMKNEDGELRSGKAFSIIDDVYTQHGTNEIIDILGNIQIFPYPKPSKLIKQLLKLSTETNGIILDFFSGSGTTAQAVMELNKEDSGNRKFILVQLPEKCDENSEAYKAGYKTIADIAKERIRRVIRRIEKEIAAKEKPLLSAISALQRHSRENGNPEGLFKDKNMDSRLQTAGMTKEDSDKLQNKSDLGFKVFKLSPSNFKIWRGAGIDSEEKLAQQLDAFTNPIRPGAEKQNMLYELMLKSGYELTSPMQYVMVRQAHHDTKADNVTLSLSKGDIAQESAGVGYYSINNNELIIALDAMNEKLIEQIIAAKPQKVITLDSLFIGNDQLKTNTVLQMRDAGVDFKTI